MSRSYKKTPLWCDSNPWAKNKANRRVRRYKGELSDGSKYKRLYPQWDICDYRFGLYTKGEVDYEIASSDGSNLYYPPPKYKYFMK